MPDSILCGIVDSGFHALWRWFITANTVARVKYTAIIHVNVCITNTYFLSLFCCNIHIKVY